MFLVTIHVEDKKLHKVLWVLDGEIVGEPIIRPVRGAKVVGDAVKSTQPIPGASLPDQVAKLLADRSVKAITPTSLGNLIVEAGGKAVSRDYVRQKLQDVKIIGKRRKDGTYPVKARK